MKSKALLLSGLYLEPRLERPLGWPRGWDPAPAASTASTV